MMHRALVNRKSPWLLRCLSTLVVCFSFSNSGRGESLAFWDFADGLQGWQANAMITESRLAADGLTFSSQSPDPFLTSPLVQCPPGTHLVITLRMRSKAAGMGQIYWGQPFSESNSRTFSIRSDGAWHNYQIALDSPSSKTRFRFDPCSGEGEITLAWLRIESFANPPKDKWATPFELQNKKVIGGGLYTIYGEETAITPGFLAAHPEFAKRYPFDGIVFPAVLDPQWVEGLGLTKLGNPLRPKLLNELMWNTIRIPETAVAKTLQDLKSMHRGHLTDNFMILGMVDGARGLKTPDLANDDDWAIIEANARLAARICRDGQLKGLWLDTEQYGHYRWRTESGTPEFDPTRPQERHFPLGLNDPQVVTKRGRDWIRAVQAEFPEIKIMTTFAWSPDSVSYGPLTGVIPFLDGVLAGIEAPGELIHAHENTFYFGHAKGTTHTYATDNGFPGDRARFDSARTDIQSWRSLSSDPAKYDRFVKVGMAAWVEDHPWNISDGWPAGTKASLWSNLPFALAYSDEYVWVWSEHTKYGQPQMQELNPFLASISNQTFNTSGEASTELSEFFTDDPLQRGWYFDFDMLSIGRKIDASHEAAVMSTRAVPYRWQAEEKGVVFGPNIRPLIGQRQRFVRRLDPQATQSDFVASFEFQPSSFGSNPKNLILFGLFHSQRSIVEQSLAIHLNQNGFAEVVSHLRGKKATAILEIPDGVKADRHYRVQISRESAQQPVRVAIECLTGDSGKPPFAVVELPIGPISLDELGVAIPEEDLGENPMEMDSRIVLKSVEFRKLNKK